MRDECVQDCKEDLRWEASNGQYYDLDTRMLSLFGCSHGKMIRDEDYKELPSVEATAWCSCPNVNSIICMSVKERTEGPRTNSGTLSEELKFT